MAESRIRQERPTVRVLIVDDRPVSREMLSAVLTLHAEYHLDPHTVASAEEALTYLQKNSVGLLITDLNLGKGLRGVELIKRIRALPTLQTIPTLLVSGSNEDLTNHKRDKAADACLPKNAPIDKLHLTITALLSRSKPKP